MVSEADQQDELAAGPFSTWLGEVEVAIGGDAPSAVPCGSCTACCTSSQFVHIGPDEVDALAHIPRALTFPAPGLPAGHVLLGYDEQGHCPMLVDGACSIYAHRPRTCRTYDCRVFPAAAVEPDHAAIARQASRWRFTIATDTDRAEVAAVRAAARYLRDHRAELGDLVVPTSPTQLAVLAIEIHAVFLSTGAADGSDGPGAVAVVDPDAATVAAAVRRCVERA